MPGLTTPVAMLATLSQAEQERLQMIGRAHRTRFGTLRRCQTAFDENLPFFEALIAAGANHGVLGLLLAEVGITRADGSPLPLGTVSGALSRARERAAAGVSRPQLPAASGSALPGPPGRRRVAPEPAGPRRSKQESVASRRPLRGTADTDSVVLPPVAPDCGADPGSSRNTASLLNRLRSKT